MISLIFLLSAVASEPLTVSQDAYVGSWRGGYSRVADEAQIQWPETDEQFSLFILDDYRTQLWHRIPLADCYPGCPEYKFNSLATDLTIEDDVLKIIFRDESDQIRYLVEISVVEIGKYFFARGKMTVYENGIETGAWPAMFGSRRGGDYLDAK